MDWEPASTSLRAWGMNTIDMRPMLVPEPKSEVIASESPERWARAKVKKRKGGRLSPRSGQSPRPQKQFFNVPKWSQVRQRQPSPGLTPTAPETDAPGGSQQLGGWPHYSTFHARECAAWPSTHATRGRPSRSWTAGRLRESLRMRMRMRMRSGRGAPSMRTPPVFAISSRAISVLLPAARDSVATTVR